MFWPITGATTYHAELGLSDKGRAGCQLIKLIKKRKDWLLLISLVVGPDVSFMDNKCIIIDVKSRQLPV